MTDEPTLQPSIRSKEELEARVKIDLKLHTGKVLLAHHVGVIGPDTHLACEPSAHLAVTGRFKENRGPETFWDNHRGVIYPYWEVTSDDIRLKGLSLYVQAPAYAMTGPDINYGTLSWLLEPDEGAELIQTPAGPPALNPIVGEPEWEPDEACGGAPPQGYTEPPALPQPSKEPPKRGKKRR